MHNELYKRIMRSNEWKKTRYEYLCAHPLCELCKEKGRYVSARCIHHIVEIETGRTDHECRDIALNPNNLQALCFECHAEVHRLKGSHTRANHHERETARSDQWSGRHKATPGGPF